MKIALPSRGKAIDDHFGHCEYFTVFTVNDQRQIVSEDVLKSPEGCGCKSNIAAVLAQSGVKFMLAGNMGQGAVNVLAAHGIQVIRGCSGETTAVAEAWLAGKLNDSGDVCRQHNKEGHDCHNN